VGRLNKIWLSTDACIYDRLLPDDCTEAEVFRARVWECGGSSGWLERYIDGGYWRGLMNMPCAEAAPLLRRALASYARECELGRATPRGLQSSFAFGAGLLAGCLAFPEGFIG